MSGFSKENRKIGNKTLIEMYKKNLVTLDAIIETIVKQKEVSRAMIKELCIFISNYSSGTKTILCRYLQENGICNAKINNMSTAELIVNFKKQVSKDTSLPCSVNTELQLIAFGIRNNLSHNLNQVEYLEKVVNDSGLKKFINFLNKISIESRQIEQLFERKIETIEEKITESKQLEKEIYHFGIKL